MLRHGRTIRAAETGASGSASEAPRLARIAALAWSPNGQKLAVATADRVVLLFDAAGELKDKFPTKPAEQNGPKNYSVKALEWSPDSTRVSEARETHIATRPLARLAGLARARPRRLRP
jgi:WD40 repeat protein